MPPPDRVAFVSSTLEPGGAERVIIWVANQLVAEGRSVVLVTFGGASETTFYYVDPRIDRIRLDVLRIIWNPFKGANSLRQVLTLRRALNRLAPDVVVSFIVKTNCLTLLATRGMGLPTVVSDRLDPRVHPLSRGWKLLRRVLYPRATRVVLQTSAALSFYPSHVQKRGRIIPNPVPRPLVTGVNAVARPAGHRVLALGRLHEQKGFDLLLRAYCDVSARHPDWTLEIWGEGPERLSLEQLVVDLGLSDRVRLPGLTTFPNDVLRTGDLFVMSSRREGFPNALCEAMACGLAVISFDCPSGPADIIRDGVDGVLVPPEDIEELSRTMDRLMADDRERVRLGARASEVVDRFSERRVMGLWNQVLREAVGPDKPRRRRLRVKA